MFFKKDVTVCSWDADTSVMSKLGSGSLKAEPKKMTNEAMKDDYTGVYIGPITYTFEGELACETGETSWFVIQAARLTKNFVFTDTVDSITIPMVVTGVTKSMNDAMKWNVTLENNGDPS